MIAIPIARASGVARPVLIVLGLAAAIGIRWSATVSGFADGLLVGLAFGAGLVVLAMMAGIHLASPRSASVALGIVGGGVLVAVAAAVRLGEPGPILTAAAPFLPWMGITILVASGEELILRGVLLDSIEKVAGAAAAILLTSVVFALMHVPLYGWHVMPLDLGVGLWLAGLRLASGGVAAPAVAHAIADLATRFL